MSSLSKFLGKPKEIEIKEEKIVLHPLTVRDLKDIIIENPTQEQQQEITKKMLKLSIKDATDEEIDNLPLEVTMILIDEINKLNGFTDERLDKFTKNIRKQ